MPEIPFAFQWTIEENRILPLKDSDYGCLCSTRVSNIPEFDYFLRIYPNGHDDESRGETWIFLFLEFKSVKKVESDFTFTQGQSYGWGRSVCSTEVFFDPEKKFIVDGKFNIIVNGIFRFERTDDAILAVVQEQKWSGGKLGDKFWERNDTKDFTIITAADGREIKVHKSVLDIRSEVFEAMVKSNMKEATENEMTITDFAFDVVETGIKLIYECNFDSKLSMDELISLLQFFDKYLLQELKAKVEPLLIAQISPLTIVRLTNGSILTNSFKLKEKCMEFLSTAIAAKTPLADFDDLDKDVFFEVLKKFFYGTLETVE